jgi:hypothetical protein
LQRQKGEDLELDPPPFCFLLGSVVQPDLEAFKRGGAFSIRMGALVGPVAPQNAANPSRNAGSENRYRIVPKAITVSSE